MSTVFLNGEYLPLENAHISVLDRGFIFGDGVYEMIPVFSGNPLRLKEHLQRLHTSMESIHITDPYSEDQWENIIHELLSMNKYEGDQSVYMQVSRGVAEREHLFGSDMKPTVFIMCRPIRSIDLSQGVNAVTHDDIRWKYCHIKAIALLPNILLKKLAEDADAVEAILIRGGTVTEGAASNVFIVRDNMVKTPPKDRSVLPGITRDLLVELLLQAGINCQEIQVTEEELLEADEIWLTSSTMGIAPVTKLDEDMVGNGLPGPIWKKVHRMYEEFKMSDHSNQ